jgi:hypothetical protein
VVPSVTVIAGAVGSRQEAPQAESEAVPVHGRASARLIDASEGACMIVVGTRGRGGFAFESATLRGAEALALPGWAVEQTAQRLSPAPGAPRPPGCGASARSRTAHCAPRGLPVAAVSQA